MSHRGHILIGTAAVCVLLACACTQHIPEIYEMHTQIVNYTHCDTDVRDRSLELYVHISGDDADHDIERIIIDAPSYSALRWTIERDHFFSFFQDGELWLGSNSIEASRMLDGVENFPTGTYTLRIIAANGYEDHMDFVITDPIALTETSKRLFPDYDPHDDMIIAEGNSVVTLRGYDTSLQPLGAIEVSTSERFSLQRAAIERTLGKKIGYFELEVNDSVLRQVFRSGMYDYRED